MGYTIRKLGAGGLGLARQLVLEWQADGGISRPFVPGEDYLQALLAKDDFHIFAALQGLKVLGWPLGYTFDGRTLDVFEIRESWGRQHQKVRNWGASPRQMSPGLHFGALKETSP